MAQLSAQHSTERAERARMVASAFGSVRAEGGDPSSVAPDAQEWIDGTITIDELVDRQLAAIAAQYGQPSPATPFR